MSDNDQPIITAAEAKALFASFEAAPALVLAVSGGPDSVALLWLMARWRRALKNPPRLIAVTVDHGLRPEAAREAAAVKRLAKSLALTHRTMRWTGAKPKTGVPAAARAARYQLLVEAARASGASHILTGHTRDDQAETVLMRLARGSGIAGLAAMARQSERDGVVLARPLLDVAKAQLIATLQKARIGFADDPTNRDTSFTRPRLRALLPALAAEGCDSRNLARLAARLARANAALDLATDAASRRLGIADGDALQSGVDAAAFATLPDEIRLRLLLRGIDRTGRERPVELGKAEALLQALDRAIAGRARAATFGQTLAGALVSLKNGRLRIAAAPPRRRPSG